jgi:hypothetical protein
METKDSLPTSQWNLLFIKKNQKVVLSKKIFPLDSTFPHFKPKDEDRMFLLNAVIQPEDNMA